MMFLRQNDIVWIRNPEDWRVFDIIGYVDSIIHHPDHSSFTVIVAPDGSLWESDNHNDPDGIAITVLNEKALQKPPLLDNFFLVALLREYLHKHEIVSDVLLTAADRLMGQYVQAVEFDHLDQADRNWITEQTTYDNNKSLAERCYEALEMNVQEATDDVRSEMANLEDDYFEDDDDDDDDDDYFDDDDDLIYDDEEEV